ncbi:MOSC domain-containing protein [Roseivivax sp. CAU 1753]
MTPRVTGPHVTGLWRHPIKGVGREEVARASFTPGATMPGDRIWAVAHDAADDAARSGAWAFCRNYIRAAGSPRLMAVASAYDPATGLITLTHPDQDAITLDPETEGDRLMAWLAPLVADNRPAPVAVIRAAARGFTDNPEPTVTICNAASHRAVEGRVGKALSPHRWRGNIWLDGLAPWEEFDWLDRSIRIGDATFRVIDRTGRCRATESNPDTGIRDADTLTALESWGHTDFSVQAVCIAAGDIATGNPAEVIR